MSREKARETFMQMIFQMDMQEDYSVEAKNAFLQNFPFEGREIAYIDKMHEITVGHLEDIDQVISRSSTNWKTSRMAKVDLAILRVAVAEMKYREDIPDAVSINEAVNLAKKYGTDTSGKFVNGLLGKAVEIKNEE